MGPTKGTATLLRGLTLAVALAGGAAAAAGTGTEDRAWSFGWDDGLTLRRVVGGAWELSLAAGPDDYLAKTERRTWSTAVPDAYQGALEIPEDYREEHGWVRLQAGRRLAREGNLGLVAFTGLTYNWINAQERTLLLDELLGDYDTREIDRFTERWVLAVGLRPSWHPTDFLSIEFAFGLRFLWENWDETDLRTFAGEDAADRTTRDGEDRAFQDFGWEGVSSLQFHFWF